MSHPTEPPSITLFGPLAVSAGSRRLGPRDFGGVKPKRVFQILLAARGRRVPKDRIADLLWSQDLPQNVDATLTTYVSVIRRRLEAAGPGGRDLVVTETEAYRFAIESADVDLDRFDALVAQAAGASTGGRRRLLDEALGLVRGEVLEDEPYAVWAQDIRDTYRARVLQARLDAAGAALAERDLAAALGHAETAVAMDPHSEPARRLAMLALYALGRQHEAIDDYQQLRRLLSDDAGLEPMRETRALHTSMLRHEDLDVLLPTPTPPPPRLGPAGRRRACSRPRRDRYACSIRPEGPQRIRRPL